MIWLTQEKLRDLGMSRGVVHRKRSQWTWRDTGRRGRNGKPIEEVLLESLPPEWQRKYLKGQTAISSLTIEQVLPASLGEDAGDDLDAAEVDGVEDRLTEALVRYKGDVRDAMIREAQRLASIVETYQDLQPKRARNADGKFEYVPKVLSLCDDARCVDPVILSIEPSRGKSKSPHTLEAWSRSYRTDGLAAFLRKPPTATGDPDGRFAEISAGAIEFLENNWRKKPSPLKLFQSLEKEAAKKGWAIPSYGWVWRKYNGLPKIVSSLVFEGEKKFAGKWGAYVPRTVEDLAALQILCGDHSVRDVTVMLPDGQLARPWLTSWLDMRTGLMWGWHLDLTPSSNTIGLAYVNGVQTFGAQPLSDPAADFYSYLYTDQGKDYRCKTLTGQTLEFKNAARVEGGLSVLCTQRRVGFMHELGIKHILARGYNAKEKPVERLHADISRWEQNAFSDEYCGKDTVSKPDSWVRAYQKHQRLLKKFDGNLNWLQSESPFMSLDDYRDNLEGWVNEYNHTAHKRTILGGSRVVPIEEYERLYPTRYEISDHALALLLMKPARRKIGKIGVQLLQPGWHFMNAAMTEFKGEEIEVRYTDGDYSRIWAVLPNGKVVEAERVERSSILRPNKRTMETVSIQRKHERKVIRDFRFLQESNWRGETTEDRVAAQLNAPDDEPESQRMAVNARPSVGVFNRMDRLKVAIPSGPNVTTQMVENANVVQGMFGSDAQPAPIKEEWED